MVLPRNLYDDLIKKINEFDEHVFALFSQRQNADSLYEQFGMDREILKYLKYPYCVIQLMNNYVIHNPSVCSSRKRILGAGEDIIPRYWSSYLTDTKCICNNDVYCRCMYIPSGTLAEQPRLQIHMKYPALSAEIGDTLTFTSRLVIPDPSVYKNVHMMGMTWYNPRGNPIRQQKRLRTKRNRPFRNVSVHQEETKLNLVFHPFQEGLQGRYKCRATLKLYEHETCCKEKCT